MNMTKKIVFFGYASFILILILVLIILGGLQDKNNSKNNDAYIECVYVKTTNYEIGRFKGFVSEDECLYRQVFINPKKRIIKVIEHILVDEIIISENEYYHLIKKSESFEYW